MRRQFWNPGLLLYVHLKVESDRQEQQIYLRPEKKKRNKEVAMI